MSDTTFSHDEVNKFSYSPEAWWDPQGPFKTLHVINPLRLSYINAHSDLRGKNVLDVGCGGGILAESMAQQAAQVVGIDANPDCIAAAKAHAVKQNIAIDYIQQSSDAYAAQCDTRFDVISCMELLEHVPDPNALVNSCVRLLKPNGQIFFSTINRTMLSYALAILAAERLCKLLPQGTHDYAKFIRPAELAEICRRQGLQVIDIAGLCYLPGLKSYLTKTPAINYLLYARASAG